MGYLRMARTSSSNSTVTVCSVKVKTQISSICPVNRILCPNIQENGHHLHFIQKEILCLSYLPRAYGNTKNTADTVTKFLNK